MTTSFALPSGASTVAVPSAERTHVACSHCQLPVPPGLITPGAAEQFCCHGCSTVWQLLHAEGLDAFYRICQSEKAQPLQARSTMEDCSEFDDPTFHSNYVRELPNGQSEVRLMLEGMHCAACVWLVEKLPHFCPGVVESRAQLLSRQVWLRWNQKQLPLSLIAGRLSQLGYTCHPASEARRASLHRKEMHQHLLKLGIAGLCSGNTMLIAFALYGGMFDGISPEHEAILRWVSAGLGLVALLGPGLTFFRGAWQALKARTPHMDISLAMGLAAGGIMGLYNTITGTGEIYFDSLCMLIFVLLIGRFLQYRQQRRAAESLSLLRSLIPRVAYRVQHGTVEKVPTLSLKPGDEVEVRVGDLVPADGVVLSGQSTLDQSLLTGESVGVPVAPGGIITAGATNLSSVLRVRVAAIGKSSRMGRLMDLVESATLSHTPIVELANRVSGYFIYLVLTLAALTLVLWWHAGSDAAINHTIALLIVACPCALGLATPMTIAIAQGRAARQKILIRRGDVFELLSRPGMLWLDKTGTLTEGKVSLKAWQGDENIIPKVMAVEQGIVHPLATALVQALQARSGNILPESCEQQCYYPGYGVQGIASGQHLLVGSRALMEQQKVEIDASTHETVNSWLQAGWTPLYIACNGQLVATAALGDAIRDDAPACLAALRQAGWEIGVLSGDHFEIVAQVAKQLQIPMGRIHGEVTPENKLEIVRKSMLEYGTIVMVGDGVNDAVALASASVGVAVHWGAGVALPGGP
ncbi:MAG TPA: heavy metal translocating P-type ATPase, partial [Gemmatales bacterium]|nr:heavy metal translocating P-type ATPase [Gemmatales bacterium]